MNELDILELKQWLQNKTSDEIDKLKRDTLDLASLYHKQAKDEIDWALSDKLQMACQKQLDFYDFINHVVGENV